MPNKPKLERRSDRLTNLRQRLKREIGEITKLLQLDYEQIEEYGLDERTPRLQIIKNQIVRSEVIMRYTVLDEHLSNALCHYFFGRKRSSIKLWKTEKYKNFNHYVVEVLSTNEKFRLLKAITKVPKSVGSYVEHLTALRNGIAHSLFPENLRSGKPLYKGRNIFTHEGVSMLVLDSAEAERYFWKITFGTRQRNNRAEHSGPAGEA